jgi:hypothetical protein
LRAILLINQNKKAGSGEKYTNTKLASSSGCSFAKSEKQLAKKYVERVNEREKNLARLASGFVFLLANPEFYSLASGYPHPCIRLNAIDWSLSFRSTTRKNNNTI